MIIHKFVTIFIAFIFVVTLVGCQTLSDNVGIVDYSIGENFGSNRDGYMIKLNNSFYAAVTYKDPNEIQIYKLVDFDSADLIGSSELFYNGEIIKCYSTDENIILKLSDNNGYVLIDCENIKNKQELNSLDDLNIDLPSYNEVNIGD